MRMLKAVVIGVAILIVVGVGVLVWGLAHNWSNSTVKRAPLAAPVDSGAVARDVAPIADNPPQEPIAAEIGAPAGMHLEQMTATADRMLLRFSGSQGDRIVVVDPKSGRVMGTISIAPAPK